MLCLWFATFNDGFGVFGNHIFFVGRDNYHLYCTIWSADDAFVAVVCIVGCVVNFYAHKSEWVAHVCAGA